MLKIMVVEDEEIIREGIISSILEKDEKRTFEIIAEAEDGEEAIKKIEQYHPDILITDIKMPFMDGITVLEKVAPKKREMFVIILSGHDEFDYAQRALKAGAYDYLLKPIKIKQLMEVLYNIKDEIDEKQRRKNELNQLKRMEKEIDRQRYLHGLLSGKIEFDEKNPKTKLFFGDQNKRYYTVGIANFENIALASIGCDYFELTEISDKFERAVNQIIKKYPNTYIFKEKLWECTIYIDTETKEETDIILERFRSDFKSISTLKMCLSVAFGGTYDAPSKLYNSYEEAKQLRKDRYLNFEDFITGLGGNQVGNEGELIEYMDFDDSNLISAVCTSNKKRIDLELQNMESKMNEKKILSQLHMVMVSMRIYSDVSKLLAETSYNTEDVLISNLEYLNQIISQTTPKGITKKLKEYCYNISQFLEEEHSGKFSKVIRRAKEFIHNNYMNENLMLENVAQHAFISASYLCIIFKKELDETFIEYLTRIRMEKASRLLLETDMRNYEIAEAIGYPNPTYFSTIFKKYFNVPPSVYRNKYLKEKNEENSAE